MRKNQTNLSVNIIEHETVQYVRSIPFEKNEKCVEFNLEKLSTELLLLQAVPKNTDNREMVIIIPNDESEPYVFYGKKLDNSSNLNILKAQITLQVSFSSFLPVPEIFLVWRRI